MNQILRTPIYNQLYYDFIAQNQSIAQFLPALKNIDWTDLANKMIKITNVRNEVKKVLIEQNEDLTSPVAQKYLKNLQKTNSVVIFTGQQPGILASPLFTVYKAVTAVKLADKLNQLNSSCNFIPVFWLESADHDFQEVNKINIWDKDFIPQRIIYQGKDRNKTSLYHYHLEKAVYGFLFELRQNLIKTEFTEALFDSINNIWREGVNWVDAAYRFLKLLFDDFGLLYFNPCDIKIKKLAVSFYVNLLEKTEEIAKKFSDTSLKLLQAGYSNQIKNITGKTFIHIEDDDLQRHHLYYKAKYFYTKKYKKKYTLTEIKNFVYENPERISTSVISRPLLQSWLLPTPVYVAGPAEIAYWAQIGGLFKQIGLIIPVIYPRISATIIEPKGIRYANTYKIDLETIDFRFKKYFAVYFKKSVKNKNFEEIINLKNIMEKEFKKIDPFIEELDPTLLAVSSKKLQKIKDQIVDLEDKILRALILKEEIVTKHLKQLHYIIYPENKIQERWGNIVYFINKFGFKIIKQLIENLELNNFNHQLLKL